MNVETLKNAGIDYDYGVRRFVGRAQVYEKVLGKFAKDASFSRISAAYEAGDAAGLLAGTHEFKGMCGNIGLTSLYEAADAIVKMLRGGEFSKAELSEAYKLLDARYKHILGAVVASLEEPV